MIDQKIVITIDPITGAVYYECSEPLNYYEIMGALGIVNALVTQAFMREREEEV